MPDLSKINIDGTEVEIADTVSRQNISNINSNITSINASINDLNTKINTDINDLNTKINTDINDLNTKINTGINDLNTKINSLDNKRVVFISDSYGDRSNSFIDYAVQLMNLQDGEWFKSVRSGAGFKPSYNSYFITLLQNLSTTITNKNDITDIVVVGGFNDSKTDTNELNAAIKTFCDYCKTSYPNAKIWIGAVGWSMNYEFQIELNNGKYMTSYKNCSAYGANYLSGSDYIMHNFDNFSKEDQGEYSLFLGYQYVHPNDTGAKLIANCIATNLAGATFHYYAQTSITVKPNSANGITFNSRPIKEIINDDKIAFRMSSNLNVSFATAQKYSPTSVIELGTVDSGFITGCLSTSATSIGSFALGFIAGGNVTGNRAVPIMCWISNSRLYAQIVTDDGTTFKSLFILEVSGQLMNVFA